MQVSSYAQETMCYVGQHLVFSEAEEVINNLTSAGINAKQIERICHYYGGCIASEDQQQIRTVGYKSIDKQQAEEMHYVSVDGSMYLTRQEGWKEIKLGRIYRQKDIVATSDKRSMITNSHYVSHLGNCKEFIKKMEYEIENIPHKIFIADGAKWIWNWVEDAYPNSIQIVDYYHAVEHLSDFLKLHYKDGALKQRILHQQCHNMLVNGIDNVIEFLENLTAKANAEKKKQQLLGYYKDNRQRMQYHVFKKKGWLIGSGAIEAAHKDVLQQRLKLTGQRWTMEGLQQMAQLRVVYKSNQHSRITKICRTAA